ncbi:Translation initiation factor IF3-1, mitochondrial [Sesamum alatum]|uniref:Translation initiation factor IF3-1, mitochondrial n=1 Tax=Sesamum alatum TaxID=300844 RepID=A0AAE2CX19_9LAMI|nr:Translation initiation factor IF3-1, mitochondrial [Sesamum alatum]
MALWSRLRQSKLKFHLISNAFRRCYTLNHGSVVANQRICSRTLIPVLNNPNFTVPSNQLEYFCKVRSYAAPVQAYQKKEERDTSGPRLNEQITAPSVRLVGDEGHCVVSRYEALARAKSLKMDLVEVDRHGKPPVCKIFNYNKEKYVQELKEKERAKSKATLKKAAAKEVRFAAKIKQNDLKMKADMVKRLMESGYRVKCTAIDPTEGLDLETLLSRFCALIEDVAIEESGRRVENKQAYVVVRHIKFGPPKKGSGKTASKTSVSSKTGSQSSNNQPSEENGDTVEAGLETEQVDSEELSDEDVQTSKSELAVFDGDDDIHSVFDINDEENGLLKSSKTGPSPYSVDRNPRHVVESAPTNTRATENRYARDPRSARPSRVPTDANGRSGRNTMNSVPQIPNQGRQPQFSMNTSSQTRPPTRQVEVPAYEASKQESPSSSTPNSPKKGYGIFSPQQVNATSREQNAPGETNRYKKNGPTDSARIGSSHHRNPQNTDSRMNRVPGVDKPGQGKWGIFSTDNPNVIPNKQNESQAEAQRR